MCLTYLFRLIFEGPSHWYEEFPVAKEGKRQSPIDIQTAKAVLDEKLRAKVSLSFKLKDWCSVSEPSRCLTRGEFIHFWSFSFWIQNQPVTFLDILVQLRFLSIISTRKGTEVELRARE